MGWAPRSGPAAFLQPDGLRGRWTRQMTTGTAGMGGAARTVNNGAWKWRSVMALTIAGCFASAWAQTPAAPYPSKTVTIVVPFSAGGGVDTVARMLADKLRTSLGQPVVVDNKPGASAMLGAQAVVKAAPDGHTLLLGSAGETAINPHVYKERMAYKPERDLAPISLVVRVPNVLVAQNGLPVKNVEELVAYAKANPDKLNYASYSPGSTSHLNAELLQMRTGIKMLHVPYKGATDASRALVAGDVQLYFDGTASAVGLIKAGKAKGIGSATPTRVSALPDLPTIQEQGVDGINIVGWQGVFGAGKMSPALTDKVSNVISKASRSKEMLALIETQGNEASGAGAAEFARIVASDSMKWGEVIKAAGIRLD